MRRISDTIERLTRHQDIFHNGSPKGRLKELHGLGCNPGELIGWHYIPEDLQSLPALVVVLHGCTQTASDYDEGSGWSRLAEDFGFVVLFPEQTRQNNPNRCFNWFYDGDIERDQGEVLSIREMIGTMVSSHGIDPKRVFVTGLSAGGAMANAMLVVYPEVFAGGAIIAGLPYGTASTIPQAFDRMRGHGHPSLEDLHEKLRTASSHTGPWPVVSVWHGTEDRTVDKANAQAIVSQWSEVHGVGERPSRSNYLDGLKHSVWTDSSGRDVIEVYCVTGLGHGTPIDATSGYGHAAPHMADVGISSTEHIARGWGLTPSFARKAKSPGVGADKAAPTEPVAPSKGGIQNIIEDALRTAGLMR